MRGVDDVERDLLLVIAGDEQPQRYGHLGDAPDVLDIQVVGHKWARNLHQGDAPANGGLGVQEAFLGSRI